MKHTFLTRRLTQRLALLAGALLLLSGCATNAANSIEVSPGGTAQVTVKNSGLQSECELRDGAVLYEGDIMAAWVLVQSHVDEKQTLEGRWTWMDRDGFQLDDGTRAWKTVFVNALEEQKIMGRSPNAKAVRGTYELRYHSGVTDGDE